MLPHRLPPKGSVKLPERLGPEPVSHLSDPCEPRQDYRLLSSRLAERDGVHTGHVCRIMRLGRGKRNRQRGDEMFSSRNRAERTTAQAWDYLSSAMTAAGDTASELGGHTADAAARFAGQASRIADRSGKSGQKLAGKAQKRGRKLAKKANKRGSALAGAASSKADEAWSRAGAAADEAWSRANAAADALAGRKRRPWGLLLGFGLLGGAIGFAAAGAMRAAKEREAETHELEMAGNTVIVTPSYDD